MIGHLVARGMDCFHVVHLIAWRLLVVLEAHEDGHLVVLSHRKGLAVASHLLEWDVLGHWCRASLDPR
jgi:hypothetical protein